MIKIGVASPDLDKQLALLKYYPELIEAHFRPAVKQAVDILKGGLRSIAPRNTGKAVSSIRSSVKGRGVSLSGSVGFGSKGWYMNIVEYGAKPHPVNQGSDIRSRKGAAKAAKRGEVGQAVNINGNWVTMRMHPGFGGRFFVKQNAEDQKSGIDALMLAANERTLAALAVK
jgi:hypothetical protein